MQSKPAEHLTELQLHSVISYLFYMFSYSLGIFHFRNHMSLFTLFDFPFGVVVKKYFKIFFIPFHLVD